MSKRLREWRLSRARAARAEKPAAPDPPATAPDPPVTLLGRPATAPDLAAPDPELIGKFAGKAHDLDTARRSVEEAASVGTGLWLSYLFVLVYFGIAAGAVTHKDLLLENPVKLPFLSDVPLPLIAFFVLAPIVFIVSHAYTLVHFVMLAAKVDVFNTELKNQLGNATETKECLRWQLPSNIFVQILAGPADMRGGGLGFLLKGIALSSLVIGPVLLLLLIQVQFLPFHLWWVTLVHRGAVLADLTLLWSLWPAVVDSRSKLGWPRPWHHKRLGLASLVAIGLAFTAATFPGEGMEDWIGGRQWIPPNSITARLGQKDDKDQPIWTSFHDLLFNGSYDPNTRRRRSPFSNTLVLPGFDALEAAKIDDPKKLDAIKQTLALDGRHLESAIFLGADLRKADLDNAYLQGASLLQAKLQGARFYKAQLQGADLYQAKLQCASLAEAQLQGVRLENAELQGAFANGAQFQGASLRNAYLQGAALDEAKLRGASLAGARHAISKGEFPALREMIMNEVPEVEDRPKALKRMEEFNQDISGNEVSELETLEKEHVDETALAADLKSLACFHGEDALPIVRGLVANGRIKDTGAHAPGLVEAILKPDCPVSAALTEADKAALKEIANKASGAH